MKYPMFAGMGRYYPAQLEAQFERVLIKIVELWDSPEIHDYFSELLIDQRGGRKGFPPDVMADLMMIREFRELQTFRAAERQAHAVQEMAERGVALSEKAFLKAFADGDKQVVDLFVRARFPLPDKDAEGVPLLLSALKRGYTVVAKIILSSHVDVNVRDGLGLTPLLVACGKPTAGYREVAERLIVRGANVNVHDALGNTPLMLALSGGMLDIARVLILNGASVLVCSRSGETPLSMVMKHRGPEATELAAMMVARNAVE